MDVSGGHHRLAQFLAQLDNGSVIIPEILIILRNAFCNHKAVVADGLDFQKIIETGDTQELVPTAVCHHCLKQFARLTGRADDNSLPPLCKLALGNTRYALIVAEVGIGDQPVEVAQSCIVLGIQDDMPGLQRCDSVAGLHAGHCCIDLRHVGDLLFLQHLKESLQHIAHRHGVVHRTVVVKVRRTQGVRYHVELIFVQSRQKPLRHHQCIKIGRIKL